MQMGVSKTKTAYLVVWTIHDMVKEKINFDKEQWESMKSNFEMFYKDFISTHFFQSKGIV